MVTKTRAHKDLIFVFVMIVILCVLFGYGLSFIANPGSNPFIVATILGMILFFETFLILPLLYQVVGGQWSLANEEFEAMVASKDKYIKEILGQVDRTKSAFLTQEIVDARLRDLALAVQKHFVVEVKLREDNDEEQLSDIATLISNAKKEFWSVHKLAAYLGFEVHPKIGDYTTD